MLKPFLSALSVSFLPLHALADNALPNVIDIGTYSGPFLDPLSVIDGQWGEIESCEDLTIEGGRTGLLTYFSSYRVEDGAQIPFSLACAIQEEGHSVIGWTRVTGQNTDTGGTLRRDLFLIELDSGDELVIDGSRYGNLRHEGVDWQYADMNSVWNAENGRYWYLPQSRRPDDSGIASHPLTAWILGEGEFDVAQLGIRPSGDLQPPENRDIERGLIARVNQIYPQEGCSFGFGSSLQISGEIEVCVNYNDIVVSECDNEWFSDTAYRCDLSFAVEVGSSTHPQYNAQFREQRQPYQFNDARFVYSDADGWIWDSKDSDVHDIVPDEFRVD